MSTLSILKNRYSSPGYNIHRGACVGDRVCSDVLEIFSNASLQPPPAPFMEEELTTRWLEALEELEEHKQPNINHGRGPFKHLSSLGVLCSLYCPEYTLPLN